MEELKIILRIISDYTCITGKIISEYDGIQLPRVHPVSLRLLFLKRLHYNSLVIHYLLGKYFEDRSYKSTLYIILRVCISDFLNLKYFDKIIKDNQSSQQIIEDNIKGYLVDSLYYLSKDFDKAELEALKTLYPEFFDSETGGLIESNQKSISKIAAILQSDNYYLDDYKAYVLYDQFSKYEHISALTIDFEKNHPNFIVNERNSIVMSIIYILYGLENLLVNLPNNDVYLNDFKKVTCHLDKLIEK
jgi:hypothetical protein